MNKLVLIDFSWVLHRSHHAYKELSCVMEGKTVLTGSFYGFVRLIPQLQKLYPPNEWNYIFCVDDGDGGRKNLLETYKAGREYKPEVWQHEDDIITFLSLFPGVGIFKADGYEADDVIATLARGVGTGDEVVIYSGDNDLVQLINTGIGKRPRVVVRRSLAKDGMDLTEKYVEGEFGVHPVNLLLYRSLIGDSSDKIPSVVPRLNREAAMTMSERYRDPQDALMDQCFLPTSKPHKQFLQLIKDDPGVFKAWTRNYELMSLKTRPLVSIKEEPNPEKVRSTASRLSMKSLLAFL